MPHEPSHGNSAAAVRDFFTPRAADWDSRFPDDGPAYAAAVADLEPRTGDAVLDAGCGTGRALPVPVMRMVQKAVDGRTDTGRLAEVFLGGLM
ncbi:hypothetical protein ABZ554_24530, partial [Streptomyces sp. NPDC020125]